MIPPDLFYALNPWQKSAWRADPGWVQRDAEARVGEGVARGKIQLVLGPRRAGKTTLMKCLIHHQIADQAIDPRSIFYLNFDDLALRAAAKQDPNLLLEIISQYSERPIGEHTAPIFLYLDELQKLPDYFHQVKLYHDAFGERVRFVISGSSSVELGARGAETLAGRVEIRHVHPFSLKELVRRRLSAINLDSVLECWTAGAPSPVDLRQAQTQLLHSDSQIKRLIQEIVVWGLMPDVHGAPSATTRTDFLSGYRFSYLERDIRALPQVGSVEDFSRLLDILLTQVGGLLDKSKIGSEAGLSKMTVQKYLDVMSQTFAVHFVSPFTRSARRRLAKRPKVFAFDVGVASAGLGILDIDQLRVSNRLGPQFENLCFSEILKVLSAMSTAPRIHYWRTSTGVEVDFVLQHGQRLLPIETKWTTEASLRDCKHLRKFKADYADQVDYMLFIYNGLLKVEEDVIFLPLYML